MTINTSGTGTAADFLNSIGVNTRSGDALDGYENTTLVIQSLKFLGIDKVRDAFTQYDKGAPALEALADAGIQFDLRVRYTVPQQGDAGIADFLKAVNVFQAEHKGSILSIEGLNEIDLNSFTYKGGSTAEAAAAFQKALYTAVKGDAGLSSISVLNLSIGYDKSSAYSSVGNLGAYSDYANAHIYTQTGAAADAQMERTMGLAKGASQGDPLIITEMGHTTLSSEPGIGVDETAQAKMVLTNLFNAYENGAQQTYLYELLDTPGSFSRGEKEAHFGLFNADGSPKMAATAIHNMNAILSAGDAGGATSSTALSYTLQGTTTDTHSLVLQKSGGVSDLVLWQDTPVWNDVADVGITNPSRNVTVTLDHVEAIVRIYDPLTGTAPIATYYNVKSFNVSLVDHPLIVEVGSRPSAAPDQNAPATDLDLVLTGTQLIAQIDSLAKMKIGSITLSGDHILSVSTAVTMKYILDNYANVLAKIDGGYGFSVSTPQSTWKKVEYFDATGKGTQIVTFGLKGDAVVSKVVTYPDGSKETYAYNITGKTYVTEKQVFDAKGNVIGIDRVHADGSYDYREARGADGGKDYKYYDATGHLLNDVSVDANGTNRTLTYDAKTGKLTRDMVTETNGERSTLTYTNGIKTLAEYVHADGGKETLTYDATTGTLLTDIIKYAGGGSLTKVYKSGVLSAAYDRASDGSGTNATYGITGKTYVTEKQTIDAKGAVIAIDRFHTDGSFDYREQRNADGSKHYVYYNTAGTVINDVTVSAAGTTTTLTYDAAGKLSRQMVLEQDGQLASTYYNTAGAKTSTEISRTDGSKESLTYDSSTGKVATDIVKYANGALLTKIYKLGVLSATYDKKADGSTVNYAYNIAGKTYVTEKQTVDAKGNVVAVDRYHTDGSYDYQEQRNSDGSKHFVYYSATGKVLNDVTVSAAGTTTTLTYDTVGKLTRQMVLEQDGQLASTYYNTTGAKTSTEISRADGSKETISYDLTTGKITTDVTKYANASTVTKVYKAGILSASYERKADGSGINYAYNITGKTYVTEKQTVDAKGSIMAIDRYHTDGSYDYQEQRNTDGSKHFAYYNAAGKLLNDVKVVGATTTTLTYDATTGKLGREMIVETGGDSTTVTYTGGVKSGKEIIHIDGGKETIAYDLSTGKMTSDIQKYADGSSLTKIYKAGVLSASYDRDTDGSGHNVAYNITGKTYVTEKQTVDSKGVVTGIDRLHSDGTLDYHEVRYTDGGKLIVNYTADGTMLNRSAIHADGTRDVDYFLQNGSGDIRHEVYDSKLVTLSSDTIHLGSHNVTLYADGQTLQGGAGDDIFNLRNMKLATVVYGGGTDTINNINLAGGDHIVLHKTWAESFNDLHMSQSGTGVVIAFDHDNSIVLQNTQLSSIHADAFVFA